MELSLDTASERASVALSRQGELIAELTWRCRANHSVELLPAVDSLLARGGVARAELELILVCRGPGSYGGLRAGLSTGMALAFALGVPVAGAGRLEIDAYQHAAFPGPVCAVHQAGRGELAWAAYEQADGEWHERSGPRLAAPEALMDEAPAGALFCGELPEALIVSLRERRGLRTPLATGSASVRRAGALAELGWRRYVAGGRLGERFIEPIYLREPQITVSKRTPFTVE